MSRIAALRVADFPLAALLRAEPDLRGRPVAVVTDGAPGSEIPPRARLAAFSAEARAEGVRRGLTIAEARAITGRLVVRRVSEESLCAAAEALADVADSFSPRVESDGEGVAFLDLDGLETLFGDERHLATLLAARAHRIGLDAAVGIASTKASALLAARRARGGIEILSPNAEKESLAPLPLAFLLDGAPDASDLSETFARWGIRTLGDLARLPRESLGQRLGAAGLALWRRARGEDETPLSVRSRPLAFEESVDCEYAIDSFEPLSFLLRAAVERLVARLDVRGLRAGDLELRLRLADGGCEQKIVRVAAPTNEVKVILTLVRLAFENHPPRAPIEAFVLAVDPERLRAVALDLFAPAGPAPEDLDAAVARLAAIAGNGRIGRAVPLDSHRPDAFVMESFGVYSTPSRPQAVDSRPVALLALRAFRPPARLHVVSDRARPDFVQGDGHASPSPHGRVVNLAGPWRLTGEWWREVLKRDYYDVELTDGCVYRIYREHESGDWYADGVYD